MWRANMSPDFAECLPGIEANPAESHSHNTEPVFTVDARKGIRGILLLLSV